MGNHPGMTPYQLLADAFGLSGDQLTEKAVESAQSICDAGIPVDAGPFGMGYAAALLDVQAGRLSLTR